MKPHLRAIAAAAAHSFVSGKKVAGVYDHTTERHLRIAAEARSRHLQGYDGDRDSRFGGSLPNLRDVQENASIHMEVEENVARGYDYSSSSHFSARIDHGTVQLYDHAEAAWFSFSLQVA